MLAVFFYKELFLGRVFSPADQLYLANPWQAVRPPTFHTASNPLRSDETLINFPHRFDIAGDFKQYGLTLWQDHTFAGTEQSFSLDYLAGWIYLPMLTFLVLAPGVANTILHLTIPLYAGLAMYLLCTLLTRHRWARAFGAIAFALNGYSIVWLSSFVLPVVIASLPLGLYFGLRFMRDRRVTYGILFSIVFGAILYFAYPPAIIIYTVITAIFLLAYWFAEPATRTVPLLQLAGFAVIGLGLGLVALLPTIADLRHVATTNFHGPLGAMPLRFVKGFVFPNFAGNPIANDWRSGVGNYCEYIAYAGSLPLMLGGLGAVIAATRRLQAPLAVAAVIVGLLSFLLTYAGPVVRVVNRLPLLYDLNPDRWTIGIDFAAAVLAVIALDVLLSTSRSRLQVIGLAASVGLVGALALASLLHRHVELLHLDAFIVGDTWLRLALIAAGGAVAVSLALVRRPAALLAGVATLIVAVDLVSFGIDFNPAIPTAEFYPVTPALRFLQTHAGNYRVLPAGGVYTTDDFTVYGLDVVTGYDHFRDDRYVAMLGDNLSPYEHQTWSQSGFVSILQQPHLEIDAFNLLAVKYAYFPSRPDDQAIASWQHWSVAYSGADGTILENQDALPKQFLIDPAGSRHGIDHAAARPDRDQLTVDGGGTLVWSKPWSTDWHVTVDGRRVSTDRYAGYFLSASLPPGRHQVALSYEPAVYLWGAAGTALAALILVLIALVARFRFGGTPRRPEELFRRAGSRFAPSSRDIESQA